MPFVAAWKALEFTILSEVREDKYITHMWTLIFKSDTNELIYRQKQI